MTPVEASKAPALSISSAVQHSLSLSSSQHSDPYLDPVLSTIMFRISLSPSPLLAARRSFQGCGKRSSPETPRTSPPPLNVVRQVGSNAVARRLHKLIIFNAHSAYTQSHSRKARSVATRAQTRARNKAPTPHTVHPKTQGGWAGSRSVLQCNTRSRSPRASTAILIWIWSLSAILLRISLSFSLVGCSPILSRTR